MVEDYSTLPEFEIDALRKERPVRARLLMNDHALRHEVAKEGYFIEAEGVRIRTRSYYIVRLDDPNRVVKTRP